MTPTLSLSVVSHGQIELINALLHDLQLHCELTSLEVLLTLNLPEELPPSFAQLTFPLQIIRNPTSLGFSENHNRAFAQASGDFFCVINPDIRLEFNIFPALIASLRDASLGVVAPLIVDAAGRMEDSARKFPTPYKIIHKALGYDEEPDYSIQDAPLYPDWVGGMFMLFRREVFLQIQGFNQKYFLYYEDVDLCARLWLRGLRVALLPQVRAIHLARRSSRGKLRFFLLHVGSMARFFFSPTFFKVIARRRKGR